MNAQPSDEKYTAIDSDRMSLLETLVRDKLLTFLRYRLQTGNEWHIEATAYNLTGPELEVAQDLCLQYADAIEESTTQEEESFESVNQNEIVPPTQ